MRKVTVKCCEISEKEPAVWFVPDRCVGTAFICRRHIVLL